jgi:hypothetical protein
MWPSDDLAVTLTIVWKRPGSGLILIIVACIGLAGASAVNFRTDTAHKNKSDTVAKAAVMRRCRARFIIMSIPTPLIYVNVRFPPIADVASWCELCAMSFIRGWSAALIISLASCSSGDIPPERLFQRNDLCVAPGNWAAVVAFTKTFGDHHDMQLDGGGERSPGEGLNVSLVKVNSWLRGPELTLWVASDPFKANTATFSAISRENMTVRQRALARSYLEGLTQLGCYPPRS